MRVLVIGFGTFGLWFARSMKQQGHEVLAMDLDEALVDRHAESVDRAIVGDARDPAVLERAGVRGVDAAVIGTASDLATTILTTVALRDLGIRAIYAKVRSTNEIRALEALDITESIFPEREAAFRLAHRIASKAVLDYVPLAPDCSMQEVATPDAWVGQTILEIDPRSRHGIQIIAVRDALTGELSLPPDPGARFKPSDSLLVAGRDAVLEEICGR